MSRARDIADSASTINALDNVTASGAELNILDGVTSTTAELNILDGVTSTAAELNILDGVTSTASELNILDGVTATATEINKLDALSRGSLIYGNASAETAILTKGSANQVLTSDGTDIAWANAAAGGTNGWEYISQVSASSSSTVDVEGMDSTYVAYKILAYDVQVAGSQFEYKCRFKQSGSYVTSNYTSKVVIAPSDNTNVTGENVSGNHMLCHRAYMGNTTSEVMALEMTIPNPSNSTTDPLFWCESVSNRTEDQSYAMYRCHSGGVLKTSGAITGVQFFPSSGTTTSGIFKLYGLKGS